MIEVSVACSTGGCENETSVDVYIHDWTLGVPISKFLPPDWEILERSAPNGYIRLRCDECAKLFAEKESENAS